MLSLPLRLPSIGQNDGDSYPESCAWQSNVSRKCGRWRRTPRNAVYRQARAACASMRGARTCDVCA